ncbi:MAG TPA: pyridoxal phosphate-dependent aminotransferase [Vicinamibacteria bacterium]|nr:pyridoxal phosphate-dependent aminotransferase [Vicinamibacteria bacterium]
MNLTLATGPALSRRARMIEVSPTVAMSQRASALRASGRSVLDFSVGEPDQPTPPHIVSAATRAMAEGKTKYAPASGTPELRRAVVERYRQDFGVAFEPAEATITIGGKQALYLVCQALLGPGDEMVLPAPYWPTFAECPRLAGAKPVIVRAREKDGFAITARLVSRAVTPKTRAILINSPSNPTGAVVGGEELLALARTCARRGITLLYDDTYARLSFAPTDRALLGRVRRELGERLVIVGTASKTYCMTGWRIGWLLSGRMLADACAALVSHSTQCPATFAMAGAVEALTGPQDVVERLAAEYRARFEFIYGAVSALPGLSCVRPGGGFYLFPNCQAYLSRACPTSLDLGSRLLEEQGVAVVPGEGFGAPGYFRLSFARSMVELKDGAARLGAFLRGLGT